MFWGPFMNTVQALVVGTCINRCDELGNLFHSADLNDKLHLPFLNTHKKQATEFDKMFYIYIYIYMDWIGRNKTG